MKSQRTRRIKVEYIDSQLDESTLSSASYLIAIIGIYNVLRNRPRDLSHDTVHGAPHDTAQDAPHNSPAELEKDVGKEEVRSAAEPPTRSTAEPVVESTIEPTVKPNVEHDAKPGVKKGKRKALLANILSISLMVIAGVAVACATYWYLAAKTNNFQSLTPTNGQIIANLPDGSNEATDESRITEELIANHRVANDEPRVLEIPGIGIRTRVLGMRLNNDNTIQSPTNVNDVGWYAESAKPGVVTGSNRATFIDGHDLGPTGVGIFHRLGKLSSGDEIIIEKGNGQKLTYTVRHKEIVPLADIDMKKALTAITSGRAGLNLMTCDGAVTKQDGKTTQTHRLIVYAELTS